MSPTSPAPLLSFSRALLLLIFLALGVLLYRVVGGEGSSGSVFTENARCTTARVVGVERESGVASKGAPVWRTTYAYQAGGEERTGSTLGQPSRGHYKVGDELTVEYMPDAPAESRPAR